MLNNSLLKNIAFFAPPLALSVAGREGMGGGYVPQTSANFTRTRAMKSAHHPDLPPPTTRPGPARLSCLDSSRRDRDVEDALKLAESRGLRRRLKVEVGILIGVVAFLSAAFIGICIYAAAYGLINMGTDMAR